MIEVKSNTAEAGSFTWRTLLLTAAAADLFVHAILVVFRRDLLALTLATIILVGLGLWTMGGMLANRPRPAARWIASGLPGLIVLALVFADTAAYTVTGAASNLLNREAFVDIAIPGCLGLASLAGLCAAVAAAITRSRPAAGSRAAPWVGVAAIVTLGLLLAGSLFVGQRRLAPVPQDTLELQAANMRFSTTTLTATSGQITVRLANCDLFWHTFNFDSLGVSVQEPVGGAHEITFTAPPGTYTYNCGIPGHALIGMLSTLIVR